MLLLSPSAVALPLAVTAGEAPPLPVPDWFWLVTAGVFGAILGSFLNCYIYRWPRRISILKRSRSFCPRCRHQLAWYDNIPVISWMLLAGRCRYCRTPISWMYPTVELLTAGLFVLTVYTFGILNRGQFSVPFILVYLALVSALVAISFIDCQVKRIPDQITKPGIVLALILSLLVPSLHRFQPVAFRFFDASVTSAGVVVPPLPQPYRLIPVTPHPIDSLLAALQWAVLSGGILFALGVIWRLTRRKDAMGFGDVKLMAMVGALIGHYAFLAIMVAATVGVVLVAVGALVIAVLRYVLAREGKRKFTLELAIPFGPLLAIGTVIMIFWGPLIIGGYLELMQYPDPVILDYYTPLFGGGLFE